MAREFPLFENERIRSWQIPHPISVLHLYLFSTAILLWSVFLHVIYASQGWSSFLGSVTSENIAELSAPLFVILLWVSLPLALSILASIRKRHGVIHIFLLLVLPVAILIAVDILFDPFEPESDFYARLVVSYGLLTGVLSLMIVDFYRHSVRYYFTNKRIILSKKTFSHSTQTISYDTIVSVTLQTDWLDQLFDVGALVLKRGVDEGTVSQETEKKTLSYFFTGTTIMGISKPEELLERLGLDLDEEHL